MRLTPLLPDQLLAPYVLVYWHLHGDSRGRQEKVLPNGVVELIFNLGNPHRVIDLARPERPGLYRDAWVAGVQRGPLVIESTVDSHLFGVRLRPEGARVLLQLPLSELTDTVVETNAVWGRRFEGLHAALAASPTARACAGAADEFFLRSLRLDERRADRAVAWIRQSLTAQPNASIDTLSRTVGLSARRLRERFADNVGVSPKTLARVYRLQHAIALAGGSGTVAWADVAAVTGFSDQPHMIREFRALTHASPSEYLKLRDEDENHMRLA
jgi:AraC-like DNA-binding protein